MLLHRLPLDPSPLRSVVPDEPPSEIDSITRLCLRKRAWVLRTADAACVLVLSGLVVLRGGQTDPFNGAAFAYAMTLSLFAWSLASRAIGLYSTATLQTGTGHIARAVVALTFSLVPAFVVVGASSHSTVGAAVAPLQLAALAALMTRVLWETLLWLALRRGACIDRVIVLADSSATARFVAADIERRTAFRMRVAASAALPGLPGSPALSWIEFAVASGTVDRILLATTDASFELGMQLYHQLHHAGIEVVLLPDIAQQSGAMPMPGAAESLSFNSFGRPLSDSQAALKRAVDVICASCGLVGLAPVLILIAVAIKLDSPGPIFFRQKRAGLHGATFLMWKFRTMYTHLQDNTALRQTSRNDERVTRVGRLLRRLSLDELPQLFNVLLGSMSLVGPRPHALGMIVAGQSVSDLVRGYAERYSVKPGITGWAQINGCRGEVDEARKLRRRVALDCYYIENWSLSTDIAIMLRTTALLFADRHAY